MAISPLHYNVKTMAQLEVFIDKIPENYCASAQYGEHHFVATGKTLDEVKRDMQEAVNVTHEWLLEEKQPSELDSIEFVYTLSISALLASLTNVLTRTALSKATGINPKQLSHYALGIRKPREAQAEKIRLGIRSIGLELSQI